MKLFAYAGTRMLIAESLVEPLTRFIVAANEHGVSRMLAIPSVLPGEAHDTLVKIYLTPGTPFTLTSTDVWLADPPGTFEAAEELAKWANQLDGVTE